MASGSFARVLLACLLFAGPSLAQAQESSAVTTAGSPATPAGIRPLNEALLNEALANGESGNADGAYLPYEMRATAFSRSQTPGASVPPNAAELFDPLKTKPPFYFSVTTPYSIAVSLAKQAYEKYEGRPTPTPEELNEGQVMVFVGPPDDASKADSVVSVTIRRGSDVVQPVRTEMVALRVPVGEGQSRAVDAGDFTFPFSTFEPSSNITLVIVGKAATYEWMISREELARMK